MNGQLLTIPQVCKRLQVCPTTIYNLVRRRKITHAKLGGAIRFRPEDVENYIKQCMVPSTTTRIPE